MKRIISIITLVALSSCSGAANDQSKDEQWSMNVGRFQPVPASNGYPPMVLDTATGCIRQIVKLGEGDAARIAKAPVSWESREDDRSCIEQGITGQKSGIIK